jgi:hypothetical protein
MIRKLALSAVVATALFAASTWVSAAPAAQQEMAAFQYLVGTWNCAHTVGTFSGTYTTTYAKALDGRWLKQAYDFPPEQVAATAVRAEYFMGYDERRQGWVRFGVMSNGQYFAIRMTTVGDGGWSWKYVSFFPRQNPETPGSDATFTRKSDSEYVIDGPSYEQNGTRVTEHHVCKKV